MFAHMYVWYWEALTVWSIPCAIIGYSLQELSAQPLIYLLRRQLNPSICWISQVGKVKQNNLFCYNLMIFVYFQMSIYRSVYLMLCRLCSSSVLFYLTCVSPIYCLWGMELQFSLLWRGMDYCVTFFSTIILHWL